ncbi:hypothetical protein J3E64_000517 [Sphingobium sp. OAS761]|uniref:hypothetical protein n=1 Tax=Sphingobium sp. OAS761 TaxID=2817901 RepID=UPI0020A050E2|nr:hypothetical protein [Sphingobium sp. OAS761]MCP1468850.1 hypothetical protein [Sphingobium sp. OAS761]
MHVELMRDHDGLRVLMREFAQAMDRAGSDEVAQISRLRVQFSQRFREHMGREDAYVRALRGRMLPPSTDKLIRHHNRALVALFLRYSDHIKYWTSAQIVADWQEYRLAVLALQDGLYDKMEWEEAYLHPLLDGGASTGGLTGPIRLHRNCHP